VTAFERVGSSSSVKTVGILATLQEIDGKIVAAYRKLRRFSIKQRVQVVLAPRRGSFFHMTRLPTGLTALAGVIRVEKQNG
jgi:hypothetical protein